jgi:hypothetical protein
VSADHRKPFLAFVVLAFVAAAIVGVQRADAQPGRFLAAVVSTTVRVQGTLPSSEGSPDAARHRLPSLGSGFAGLGEHAQALIRPVAGSVDASAGDETSQVRADRETGPARDKESSDKARQGRLGQEDQRTVGRHAEALEKAHDSDGASAERTGRAVRAAAEALEQAASKGARRAPEVSERGHSRLRRMLARAGHGPR